MAAVVVLVIGSLYGLGRVRSAPQIEPASGSPAIPTQLERPSARLSTTDEDGPLGPLAALVSTVEGTLINAPSPDGRWAGVSAATGEYRIIDMPDLSPGYDPVLSPDGAHIAYWTGAANQVTGIADYDSVTGIIRTWPLDAGLVV